MEWGPIEVPTDHRASSLCGHCGDEFKHIGENALVEGLCVKCQVKHRIRMADQYHKTGKFPVYTAWWLYGPWDDQNPTR